MPSFVRHEISRPYPRSPTKKNNCNLIPSGNFNTPYLIRYWAQNEMYMGGDRKKEKRFVGQRVVYDDGIKAYKTKCLRGFN